MRQHKFMFNLGNFQLELITYQVFFSFIDRLSYIGRRSGCVHTSEQCDFQPSARVGSLPRAGSDDQGVHARSNRHRRQVAGGVCPGLLQVLRPDQIE